MRLHIVHDRDGRILAAADVDGGRPPVRPVPVDPEHTAAHLDVPPEFRRGDLMEICQALRVDIARNRLVPAESDG